MFKRLAGLAVSGVVFPVKLVAYPLMAVVAVAHFALKNIGWMILSLFAAPSVIERRNPLEDDSSSYVLPAFFSILTGLSATVIGSIFSACHIFHWNISTNDSLIRWGDAHRQWFQVVATTNLLSLLYELGRSYANSLTLAGKSAEAPKIGSNAKFKSDSMAAPGNFLVMFNRIDDLKEISKVDAEIIGRELASMQKDGKLTGVELIQLARKASHITVV